MSINDKIKSRFLQKLHEDEFGTKYSRKNQIGVSVPVGGEIMRPGAPTGLQSYMGAARPTNVSDFKGRSRFDSFHNMKKPSVSRERALNLGLTKGQAGRVAKYSGLGGVTTGVTSAYQGATNDAARSVGLEPSDPKVQIPLTNIGIGGRDNQRKARDAYVKSYTELDPEQRKEIRSDPVVKALGRKELAKRTVGQALDTARGVGSFVLGGGLGTAAQRATGAGDRLIDKASEKAGDIARGSMERAINAPRDIEKLGSAATEYASNVAKKIGMDQEVRDQYKERIGKMLGLNEAITNRGDAYEYKVYDTLKDVEQTLEGFDVISAAPKGSDSTGEGDITIRVGGKQVNIEVKLNKNAQLGETSLRINAESKTVEIANPERVEPDAIPLYIEAGKSMFQEVTDYIKFIRTVPPFEINAAAPLSFPFGSVTTEAWDLAKRAGLLARLNQKVQFSDTKIVENFYNRKNVFYIQIGGSGLFYLGKNPMNLPVPRFQGKMQVEFRPKRSGSKMKRAQGDVFKVAGATYICTGRLLTNIRSKYSLDNKDDVIELFT